MTPRLPVPVLAALAVLLSATSLSAVFADRGWEGPVVGAVVVAAAAGSIGRLLGRGFGGALALGILLSLAGFACYVTAVFAPSTGWLGFLPTRATVSAIHDLVSTGSDDVQVLIAPAPSHAGLVLFAVAGSYLVAALTDAIAVGLRRPAVAGLPLLLLFAFPVGVVHGGVGVIPFAAAAAGYVALLLAEGRSAMRAWGRPLEVEESRAGRGRTADAGAALAAGSLLGVTGRRIGIAAVGVALVLPVALPIGSTNLLGATSGSGDGSGGGLGGGTTRVAPIVDVAQRLHSTKVVDLLHVQTSTPDYLRLTALDVFDGVTFRQLPQQTGGSTRVSGALPASAYLGAVHRTTTKITATKAYADRYLPVPFDPIAVSVGGDWRLSPVSRAIQSTADTTKGRTWTVTSAVPQPTIAELEGSGAPDKDNGQALDVSLPAGLDPRIRTLANDLGDSAGRTTYQKVATIQDFLRAAPFVYDLHGAPTGPNALSTFLFGTHRGYCEQFASAMVVLVRALGIPARVAVGFATGHSDGRGGYTITTADAHAWPEVWFQGLGWVRFEPTPRSDGTASPPAYTFQPVGGAGSTGGPSTPGTSTSTNRNGAPLPFADRGDASTDPGTLPALDPTQAQPADHTRGLLLEIVGLVLVGAAATPAVVRVLIRRRRISRRARAGAGSWREVLDTLVDVGIALPVSETPRGVARRLTASTGLLDGPAAEALWALATDEERRRYAPASSPGAAGATGAAGDVRRVRSGLLAASTRWQRVVAAVAPRSVLIRVRARVPAAVADGLDAGDRLLAAVAGRLPRVAGR